MPHFLGHPVSITVTRRRSESAYPPSEFLQLLYSFNNFEAISIQQNSNLNAFLRLCQLIMKLDLVCRKQQSQTAAQRAGRLFEVCRIIRFYSRQ